MHLVCVLSTPAADAILDRQSANQFATVTESETSDVDQYAHVRKLLESVAPVSLLLCYADDKGRPKGVGSGVILQLGDRYFLATAAHVLRSTEGGMLYIAALTEMVNVRGKVTSTCDPFGKLSAGDPFDVAVLELPQALVERLDGTIVAGVDDDAVDDHERALGLYAAIGYPASRFKARMGPRSYSLQILGVPALSVAEPSYGALGLSKRTHIVLDLRRDELVNLNGDSGQLPETRGLSGGGVFRIFDLSEAGHSYEDIALVAIATEHHQKEHQVLIGTRIGVVFDLICAHAPELADRIPYGLLEGVIVFHQFSL